MAAGDAQVRTRGAQGRIVHLVSNIELKASKIEKKIPNRLLCFHFKKKCLLINFSIFPKKAKVRQS